MGQTKKTLPHHRLTLKDVVRDYRDGLLTAKGAVFYATAASRKLGESLRVTPCKMAETIGITTRAFYKSLADLRIQKRIDFEVEGTMMLKVPISEKTGTPEYIFLEELGTNVHKLGTNVHSQGTIVHSQGTNVHKLGTNVHSQGTIVHKKSSESPQDGASESLQSLLSIQSLSLLQDGERETSKLEEDPEFRQWLEKKASQLPTKPALLNQWIDSEAKKESNQIEFLKTKTPKGIAIPENLPLEQIDNLSPEEYWRRVYADRPQ